MENFTPAFINAKNCDGFQLTGDGILNGDGMEVWELFWKGRAENKNFANTALPRARLALIESSKDVRIEGITFKDSQFWNCHLYNNDGVLVHNVHFQAAVLSGRGTLRDICGRLGWMISSGDGDTGRAFGGFAEGVCGVSG